MRLLTYIILACLAPAVSADIYRSVDENGNIIFSDTPSEGAEKIEVQETQTIKSPDTQPFRYEPQKTESQPRYESVAIVSPQNDQAIRSNSGDLTIRASVNPSLRPGDRLVLLMDGRQVGTGTSASLKSVDRGTHKLQARVEGRDGKTLASSDTVTFHLLRHSVQHPNPPKGPLNPPGGPAN